MPLEEILYPTIEPTTTGMLDLDGHHQMYWEVSGNPSGVPVVVFHGGPGAGTTPGQRRFFDPEVFKIILFDQRGAGKSRPHADLTNNTTWHLVEDIEKLREHLSIDKWHVFGGSWGSTLGLAYAETHPDRVLSLTLRGIFMCRPSEIDWFLYTANEIFPEEWRKLVAPIPEDERGNLLAAFHKRLNHPEPAVYMPAARAWSMYEGALSTLNPSPPVVKSFGEDLTALGMARIENHYFSNDSFLKDEQLLKNIDKIRHIPCVIVQGRYDIVCPLRSADDLSRAFPEAEYHIISEAGHSGFEPGIAKKLRETMDNIKNRSKNV